jgi:hypothetical protein
MLRPRRFQREFASAALLVATGSPWTCKPPHDTQGCCSQAWARVTTSCSPSQLLRCWSAFGSGMPSLVENSASLWVDNPIDTSVRENSASVR